MIKYKYETKRLILLLSKPGMERAVADYYTRNREFLRPTAPKREEKFFTIPYQARLLDTDYIHFTNLTAVRFWVAKQQEPHKIIGTVALSQIVMGNFCSCFMGYSLDKDEINNGFMTEAIGKASEIGFHEIGLHRIEANILTDNKASIKVCEKLGFVNEGIAEKYLKINDVWRDHVHMTLLNQSNPFILRTAATGDIPKIFALMETISAEINDRNLFVADDMGYFENHISEKGLTFVVEVEGKIAAYLAVDFSGENGDNLGCDVNFDDNKRMSTAHMDSTGVNKGFRGKGFQQKLIEYAHFTLSGRGYTEFMATVSPENTASLITFLKCGYKIMDTKLKYGGVMRHILHRHIIPIPFSII